jgi:hypothetical protein
MVAQAADACHVGLDQEPASFLAPEPVAVRLLRRRDLEGAGRAFERGAGEALRKGAGVDEADGGPAVAMPREHAARGVAALSQAKAFDHYRLLRHRRLSGPPPSEPLSRCSRRSGRTNPLSVFKTRPPPDVIH